MKKAAVFVDVQNIYYTTKHTFSRSFNYRYFWQQLSSQYEIVCANAYAIDKGDEQQIRFQNALKHIGFNVKLKPFIQRADGSAKGDWDVGITIDVIEEAKNCEVIILLSGDGDFDRLLRHVHTKYQCATIVYGVLNLSAQSLINAADDYVDIDQVWLQ